MNRRTFSPASCPIGVSSLLDARLYNAHARIGSAATPNPPSYSLASRSCASASSARQSSAIGLRISTARLKSPRFIASRPSVVCVWPDSPQIQTVIAATEAKTRREQLMLTDPEQMQSRTAVVKTPRYAVRSERLITIAFLAVTNLIAPPDL